MPSSNQAVVRPDWASGHGFSSADPERQGEVLAYAYDDGIETTGPSLPAAARPAPADWMRGQPDVESSGFEGSSSRHSR